jgi:hypothetical protein
MLAGEPKVHKSWFALDIAVSVATGTKAFGHFNVPRALPVYYLDREFGKAELKKRLISIFTRKGLSGEVNTSPKGAISVQLPRAHPLHIRTGEQFDLTSPKDTAFLSSEIERLGIQLLILDPLQMMLGAADDNNAASVRPVLQYLLNLKQAYGCGIMIVHHYSKPSITNPREGGHRILGTQAWYAWVESALYLTKDGATNPVTHVEREFRNAKPMSGFDIEYVGEEEGYDVEVTIAGPQRKAADQLSELEGYVLDHPEGVTLSELSMVLKVSRKTVYAWADASGQVDVRKDEAGPKGGRPKWIVVPSDVA